jgi:hypothetical protein
MLGQMKKQIGFFGLSGKHLTEDAGSIRNMEPTA